MGRKFNASNQTDLQRDAAWPAPVLQRGCLTAGMHRVQWLRLGVADGPVWLVLHGGPGSGSSAALVAPFDLSRCQVVLMDQRGSGASRPRAGLCQSGMTHLVADLERLRQTLGLARWSVMGGSWGATLALAYARQHPHRVKRLVLRGAFTLRRADIARVLTPRLPLAIMARLHRHAPALARPLGPGTWRQLCQLFHSGIPTVQVLDTLRAWQWLETRCAVAGWQRSARDAAAHAAEHAGLRRLRRSLRRLWAGWGRTRPLPADRLAWQKFRLQAHVLRSCAGARPAFISEALRRLTEQGVPVDWVHGRHDRICHPGPAWAAHRRLAPLLSRWHLVDAGHLGVEPAMLRALRACVRGGVA